MRIRILFTCGREPEYPRNAVLRAALEQHFEVVTVTDSSRSFPVRYARLAAKLLYNARTHHDLLFVGFLGQPLMLLARHLTSKPIVFDAFLSVYDTICFDRQHFTPASLPGQAAFWLDRTTCAQADQVWLDTRAHTHYFERTFGVPRAKLSAVFVGCDEAVFFPRPGLSPDPVILFYGSFLPLQGIDVIVRAAKLLSSLPDIRFRIIGHGLESARIRRLVEQLAVSNVDFRPPVPLSQLPDEISRAMICLGGHFGTPEKAARVIAGKTFQCLAMGKPTIVGDNAANRELLTHGHDSWFCPMANPEALAAAILTLVRDPDLRAHLGTNARQTFLQRASIQALSGQVRAIVESQLLSASV